MDKEKEKKMRLWEGGVHLDQTITKENIEKVFKIFKKHNVVISTRSFNVCNLTDKATEKLDEIPGVGIDIWKM